ncbi:MULTISPECIES: DNA repair protein RadA [Eisenbergiella]|jgi:DNA repair protein RadA/Sms|uniref:DNA repair protein RadA n=2 Tax=Eisenbergiella TaxID=1432051 RepID=A0A3E3HX67_9FIRM|nr:MULTISPECIES: DNA repair protein RadA [Eisenbergiella]MCI6709311.1 DNA repair protein RadA [Eisenbergiella massiliensis]MDY2653559.1 DNA repair protein RadA [Eisenbergiella porci]MDY5524809.1 DNA repair protein RadA [Eisenbergiella porci]MSS87202.1 DNA repair protein RadA [Eisenbergiella porci]RGE56431.1 DNA repair protein RadA [Eisenbergiella massiliensis]
MAKAKSGTVFYCQECGYESSKWMGQCPGCHTWNSFVEEPVRKAASRSAVVERTAGLSSGGKKPSTLAEISMEKEERILTGIGELDRVLGGGIVAGSLVLVGGDPGIGKSTLLLQMCRLLSEKEKKVLYISGEESLQQIKMRAQRIGNFSDSLQLLCETNLGDIEEAIAREKPEIVIIDSIQTMYQEEVSAAPGSVSQVRESTGVFLKLAKGYGISIFIVGHVTKEGTVAGPRVLEHMVDTVLYFEGDRHASYRILRGVKNRFGSTNEIGVFEMRQEGLCEVKNPSEFMLNGKPEGASGSVVSCSLEGTRPILVEIQALVCQSNFGFPRRQAAGTDFNRVNLLMAVLEKRLGLQVSGCDAYVNIAGGMKIQEPAIDLGIVMAVISSFRNRPIEETMIAFGEVGLSGEVRAVSQAAIRVSEAKKLGFKTCVLPKVCLDKLPKIEGIRLIGVQSVKDVMDII